MTVLQPNGPFRPTNLSVPLPPTALASAGPQTHAGSNYSNALTAKPGMPFALSGFNPHTGTISSTTSVYSATLSSFKNTEIGMYCENVTLLTSPQGQIAQ